MRYVALLRGIGPINPNMRNVKLRGVLEEMGFDNVGSVITTGNLIFDAATDDLAGLEAQIEAAWPEQLGFNSTTILRSRDEFHEMVESRPFGEYFNPRNLSGPHLPVETFVKFLSAYYHAPVEGPGADFFWREVLFNVVNAIAHTGRPASGKPVSIR